MPAYREAFPVGAEVRVVSLQELEKFKREWKCHNPLDDSQFLCAGKVFRVDNVGYYFGGDVLYQLADAPGTWHEQCLEQADLRT